MKRNEVDITELLFSYKKPKIVPKKERKDLFPCSWKKCGKIANPKWDYSGKHFCCEEHLRYWFHELSTSEGNDFGKGNNERH